MISKLHMAIQPIPHCLCRGEEEWPGLEGRDLIQLDKAPTIITLPILLLPGNQADLQVWERRMVGHVVVGLLQDKQGLIFLPSGTWPNSATPPPSRCRSCPALPKGHVCFVNLRSLEKAF